jgi:DNA-binding PadR family transcriptional regulator
MTDLIVLGMLLAGPQHGYRLKQSAGMIFGQRELHNNIVYPLLRRFMASKWVTKKTVPGERGQNRQQYAITALGRQVLLDRIRNFTEQDARSEDEFRVRVGFFSLLAAEDRDRILQLRTAALGSRDQVLSNLQSAMELDDYAGEVVRFLREQTAIERDWIARLGQLNLKAEENTTLTNS